MRSVDPDQIIRALAVGMFPMAPSRGAETVDWIEPKMRGILPLDNFHVSKTLAQKMRSGWIVVTADQAFDQVVAACAEATAKRLDTWISPAIAAGCATLHQRGYAHSVECWSDGALVGGAFGVGLGAVFAVDSMFSRVADASKMAFAHLMARLRLGGYRLVDCQFVTPHLASLGAVQIDQRDYRRLLAEALVAGGVNPATPLTPALSSNVDFFAADRIAHARAEGAPPRSLSGRFVVEELARPLSNPLPDRSSEGFGIA
jgi:leucyl/phenylalanyl-tRNA--protein transferase